MAIALVKLGTVATGATSVAPTFGQATGAGNLLIAWVNSPANPPSTTASGWVNTGSGASTAFIYYKPNSSAGETAPTFTAVSGTLTACLAEYSGADTSTPLDQGNAITSVAASPSVLVATGTDTASGDLVLTAADLVYSMAATKTTSDTYNNGATATNVSNNDASSVTSHYRFSYGITTGNSSATQTSFAFTITNITGLDHIIATFKAAGAAPSNPNFSPQGQMGFFGAHHRSFDQDESGLYVPRRRVELI